MLKRDDLRRMLRSCKNCAVFGQIAFIASLAVPFTALPAAADTIESALIQAYRNNPSLNAQRASVRATDENVPQALSGYRPKIFITATGGEQSSSTTTKTAVGSNGAIYNTLSGYNSPFSTSVAVSQTLFDGFQTANKTRKAEAQVLAARANLRNTEQTVLLSAVTAYMDLLRDSAILDLQRRNVEVLRVQLRQTTERFSVGDVTRTDVAQAESRLAGGRSSVLSAEANYKASVATYRQVIGNNPGKLAPAAPVDHFSPSTLPAAIARGIAANPSVIAAQYNIDVAQRAVKVAEGALYPTLSVQGNFTKSWLSTSSPSIMAGYSASVLGTLSIPIYQGGSKYSLIRQAKETLGQRRLNLDTARDSVRKSIVQAWGQFEAAKGKIKATHAEVQAAEIALNGVREEARAGQRTTLDVLNAQQALVNARVAVVSAQHDRVVASYTLLGAVGRLSPQVLGLHVTTYNPKVHYRQVRDSWAGLRTPSGH